jgi:imidazole glycerol-phosphate synthase subunit HisF
MPALRIIPCLDVKDGRVVKGVNFKSIRDSGDPVDLARNYYAQSADELTLLDITASLEGRSAMLKTVEKCAEHIFVPLTVGGGVRDTKDVANFLASGADKVSIGSAAVNDPSLISRVADEFGSQVLVASLDIRKGNTPSGYEITTLGGTQSTGKDALEWTQLVTKSGAGELLINSMDADGTRMGFDLALMQMVRQNTNLPIIASGGAGELQHFVEAAEGSSDALLAASVFHEGTLTVMGIKAALAEIGVEVRQ